MNPKEKAKNILIQTLLDAVTSLCQRGDKIQAPCPFHNDMKEPNFFIYTKTNTWYCFKCGVGGDSISFYMKKNNVDFKTALKEML